MWDLDNQQLKLAYWINLYASVYNLPSSDRPIESVIEDDEQFDRWMESPTRPKPEGQSIEKHKPLRALGG